jgi:hypothetical protein
VAVNSTLSPTIIAKEALRLLKNNLVMGSQVYRAYESEFPGSPKKGGTVTIRKPVKFTVTKSRVRTSSVITENSITMTVSTQAHVSWAFESAQLALTIEEISDRYIRPAASVLANVVDGDLCALYKDIYNSVWQTSFTEPNAFLVLSKALQRLDEEAAPQDERCVVLNPGANWAIANALTNLYVQEPATKALRKGLLGSLGNCEVYMDQNVKVHTAGSVGDTASTNSDMMRVGLTGATGIPGGTLYGTTGRSLVIWPAPGTATSGTAFAFLQGDVFEVANVYAVNPMSGESTGVRRQFVVTADAAIVDTTTGSGNYVTVAIEPPICNTGPYKTVSTIPAAGAIGYFYANRQKTYPQNLVFHKNAFALVMVPLEKPDGAWGATVTEDGFSIRVVKDYDIDNDLNTIRLDILYGVKTIYPELAVRLWGKEVT